MDEGSRGQLRTDDAPNGIQDGRLRRHIQGRGLHSQQGMNRFYERPFAVQRNARSWEEGRTLLIDKVATMREEIAAGNFKFWVRRMNIYRHICDTDRFKTVDMEDRYFEVFDRFQAGPLKRDWEDVPVFLVGDDVPMPNLLQIDFRVPVLTGRTLKALGEKFSDGIECLPLKNDTYQLWALNIWKPIDCLLVEQSNVRTNRIGNIIEIHRGVFINDRLRGAGFFTITGNPFVFMTETLLERIHKHSLSGLVVSKVGETV